jgi:hypothetical protein
MTQKISPDLMYVQPLSVWVQEFLIYKENTFVQIGNNKYDYNIKLTFILCCVLIILYEIKKMR